MQIRTASFSFLAVASGVFEFLEQGLDLAMVGLQSNAIALEGVGLAMLVKLLKLAMPAARFLQLGDNAPQR